MKVVACLTGIGGIVLTVMSLSGGSASASASAVDAHTGAVFVQTNNPHGNAIVAYARSRDGALHLAGTYPTGGRGGALAGAVVDRLASQGSLVYDYAERLLYVVNAGSNTVAVFAVDGDRLHRRQVVSSGGRFPVSAAASGDVVYVLNALDGGAVQGYRVADGRLHEIPGAKRMLHLHRHGTPQFTQTPGEVAFSPGGSKLVVTTKANGDNIDVFAVHGDGVLSRRPVVNHLPNAVPFGFTFDVHGHLVVTEAGPNAVATFTMRHDGTLTAIAQTVTGQSGTCWISGTGTLFYASNAGSGSVSGYHGTGRGTLTALDNTSTDPGTVDSAIADDHFLYVQTGAHGVVDGYRINADGSLSAAAAVTVPKSAGGEGIAAS